MKIRLDKYLADAGFGTRTEVKNLIKNGCVTVNGTSCKDNSAKVDTDDDIRVKGEKAGYSEYEYYMLYKPAGIITASRDIKEKTVIDLIESKKRRDLFPVGRLDRDTEGLLLITNDGDLSHRLLAPGKHVDKTYVTVVTGAIPDDIEEIFKNGIDIGEDKPTKPAVLKRFVDLDSFMDAYQDEFFDEKYKGLEDENAESEEMPNKEGSLGNELSIFEITITEGRFHEIKRMFEAVGCEVIYLKRYSMGNLKLDPALPPGGYRKLSEKELI